jgi:hypothetical protein
MEVVDKISTRDIICPKMMEIAKQGLLKHGKISSVYLVRKLKCSYPMAWLIIMALETET